MCPCLFSVGTRALTPALSHVKICSTRVTNYWIRRYISLINLYAPDRYLSCLRPSRAGDGGFLRFRRNFTEDWFVILFFFYLFPSSWRVAVEIFDPKICSKVKRFEISRRWTRTPSHSFKNEFRREEKWSRILNSKRTIRRSFFKKVKRKKC